MKMTFDQYIANPMGVKNAVYSNREMYRQLYTDKLDKILVREVGKVKYTLYTDNEEYFVHMKIPSEVIENFYYDTVIQFYTDKVEAKASKSLKDYYIKFYSNDPSFVYTFAYAMLKNDLFIRDLVPRMSKEAVKTVAKEKNPKAEVGYVKSIYFAYLLMRNYSLFDKIIYQTYSQKYDRKRLLSEVIHADIKVQARQEAQGELSKKKKMERSKSKNDAKPNTSRDIHLDVKKSSNIKSSTSIKTTSKLKTTNRSPRIKKI